MTQSCSRTGQRGDAPAGGGPADVALLAQGRVVLAAVRAGTGHAHVEPVGLEQVLGGGTGASRSSPRPLMPSQEAEAPG
ncbi:hypothetical protein ADK77_35565 [Streptomyces antibioticus]|nr:hypothetical protein ADK77_35565 [Streptomyces antibioticus]